MRSGLAVDEFHKNDLFVIVDLAEFDFDDFAAGGGDGAAYVLGLDGKFAVASVDEDEELDGFGASVVEEGVEGGADRSAGEENIVHEDDVATGDVEADVTFFDHRAYVAGGEVVAVEADVEDAGVDGMALNGADDFGDALGDGNAAALDADQAQIGSAVIALNDLVGEADEGAVDLRGRKKTAFFAQLRRVFGWAQRRMRRCRSWRG